MTLVADPQRLLALAAFGKLVRHYRLARGRALSETATQAGLAETELAALEDGQVDVSYTTVLQLADALDLDESDLWRRCRPAEFRVFHVQDVQPDAYQMLVEGYRPWHIVRDQEQFRPGDRIHLREVATGRATGMDADDDRVRGTARRCRTRLRCADVRHWPLRGRVQRL